MGRSQSESERRQVYLAIENIMFSRSKGQSDLGVKLNEVQQYTGLSEFALGVAIRFLRNQGVIYRTEYRRWAAVPLSPGFCFIHGYQHTALGVCTKCMRRTDEKTKG